MCNVDEFIYISQMLVSTSACKYKRLHNFEIFYCICATIDFYLFVIYILNKAPISLIKLDFYLFVNLPKKSVHINLPIVNFAKSIHNYNYLNLKSKLLFYNILFNSKLLL